VQQVLVLEDTLQVAVVATQVVLLAQVEEVLQI
jgi:hypothetical protein